MLPSFINLLFFFLHALGLAFIYASLFLYENEESKFQNKIEEWWIKLKDQEKASRSKTVAFVRGVAELTAKGFDRLFGHRLFSIRVIPISIYLSFASFFLFTVQAFPFIKNPGGATRQEAVLMLFSFLVLALVPAFFEKEKWLLMLWWAIIPVMLASISGVIAFAFMTRGPRSALRGIGLVTLLFFCSLLCDVIYIVLTRYALRRISATDRVPIIASVMIGNLLLLAIALLGPILGGLALAKRAPMAGAVIFFSFLLNSIDLLVGSAAFILALLFLLHRLCWPAIQRPLSDCGESQCM